MGDGTYVQSVTTAGPRWKFRAFPVLVPVLFLSYHQLGTLVNTTEYEGGAQYQLDERRYVQAHRAKTTLLLLSAPP